MGGRLAAGALGVQDAKKQRSGLITLYLPRTSILKVTNFTGKEVLNLRGRSWTGNVFTGQRKAQCSQGTPYGQMQQKWVWRNGTKCMSGPFILSWHK